MKRAWAEHGAENTGDAFRIAFEIDSELREEFSKAVSAGLREMWADPALRALQCERIKQTYDDDLRKKRSEAFKKQWVDPDMHISKALGTARRDSYAAAKPINWRPLYTRTRGPGVWAMTRTLALVLLLITTPATAQGVTQRTLALPPVEYDFYYPGTIVIRRGDRTFIDSTCPISPIASLPNLGCADVALDQNGEKFCHIRIINDDILEQTNLFKYTGVTLDDVVRHEMGHCNGWGTDHIGARLPETPRERPEVKKQREKDALAEERYRLYKKVRP